MKSLIVFLMVLATGAARVVPLGPLPLEIEGRITNGEKAISGQYPYQIMLYLDKIILCGGSILSTTFLLTAAHCLQGVTGGTAFMGSTYVPGFTAMRKFTSDNFTIHENWNRSSLRNDIGIIRVEPIKFTKMIQPVQLPTTSTYSSLVGETVTATGWGRTSDESSNTPFSLRTVNLTVIPNAECAEYFHSIIKDTMICTSTTSGKSTCNGDSGGPLVIAGTNIQIGIVSFGASAGCTTGHPAAFTRLTSYLDWIKEKMFE